MRTAARARLPVLATLVAVAALFPPPAAGQDVLDPRLDGATPEARESLEDLRRAVEALEASESSSTALAKAYGELGKAYLALEQATAAEAALRNAAALEKGEPRWPYYLGLLALERGAFAEAVDRFAQVTRVDPDEVAAWVRLGDALLDAGRVDESDRAFAQALELDPSLAVAHYGRGRVALRREDDAAAIRWLEAALDFQPEARKLHSLLAQAYRRQGQPDLAAQQAALYAPTGVAFPEPLVAEIRLAIRSAAFHLAAGDRAAIEGRHEFALRSYERALELDPGDARARQGLASALLERASVLRSAGRLDEARAELERVLALVPGDPSARINLASVLRDQGEPGRARQLLEEVGSDPATPSRLRALARYNLGVLAVREKADDAAIAAFEEAIALDPELGDARFQLATALGRRGDYAAAARRYEEVLARQPADVGARLAHATALLLDQRAGAARDSLVSGLRAVPGNRDLTHALARMLATSPDPTVRDGQRALELALSVFQQAKTMEHAETVAMAYAASGAFDDAERWQGTLLQEAERLGDQAWTERLRANLERYQRHQAP